MAGTHAPSPLRLLLACALLSAVLGLPQADQATEQSIRCPRQVTCPGPCTPCAACPQCRACKPPIPPGYEYFPGLGYYRLHMVPVNWNDAKETCEREGAHLAIINSEEEAALMKRLFERDLNMGRWLYMGFHDKLREGYYVTVLGEPLSTVGYTTWNVNQPDNNNNNENCGSIYPSGGLNDLYCEEKMPFVCELPDKVQTTHFGS